MAPTSLPAWNQCSNQWEGSEKQAASSCIWDVTEKVHVFLTNQGFWSGGSRNKAGLEAPCGTCSAHSVSPHSAGSWKPSVKPSAARLGLMTSLRHRAPFSHTEGAGMWPASRGSSLCRLSTLQPLFGFLKGLRQLPVNCAYQCCQLLQNMQKSQKGWVRKAQI